MAKLPKLEHVKYVRAKGNLYAYFNTGRKKSGKPIYARLPHPATPGFYDSYAAMKAARAKTRKAAYTVADLSRSYQKTREFESKAANTQKLYGYTLTKIEDLLGDFPVSDLRRNDVQMALDTLKGVGAHNIFLAVLGIIYRHGRRIDKTELSPVKDFEVLKTGSHEAWPEDRLQAGLSSDHARTRLAVHLLFYTGQRIGDVVRLRWSDIRDGEIHLTQQKTGKYLRIPLHRDLAAELDATPKRGLTIIVNENGDPMTDQVIRRELKRLGTETPVVPHGLRKNAVIALLEAGCTVPEAAAITGQTFQIVEYYARQVNQHKLGKAAIIKLENSAGTGKRIGKPHRKGA